MDGMQLLLVASVLGPHGSALNKRVTLFVFGEELHNFEEARESIHTFIPYKKKEYTYCLRCQTFGCLETEYLLKRQRVVEHRQ